jgi:ABC-2 type transport system ATP-binding protein
MSRGDTGAALQGHLAFLEASKRFGAVHALDCCSFSAARGRLLGFLGPNGAWKTTAMRAVFGLVTLDAGEVLWEGRPIELAQRLRFGYMPEERGLYPHMRVRDQLIYFGCQHGLDGDAARRAADSWMERLGLSDRAQTEVENLSHGNQQRAQLAVALLHEPDLLVLDEPFAGLDPVAVQTLAQVLRGEAARGATVVFSSHQLELVEDICEDVAIIDHGTIVGAGELDALRRGSGQRQIELRVDGAPLTWSPEIAGVEVVERHDGALRVRLRSEVDPELVLAAAAQHGPVVEFRYGPPSLTELFLELVDR